MVGEPTMTKSIAPSAILALTLFFAVVVGWALAYPSESDPESIKYVLWKNGLHGMNLETTAGTMIDDRSGEKLVVGKTRAQLREKFGYLSKPAEISPYLRGCYQDSARKDKDALLIIRQTSWMVIFDGGRQLS